MTLADLIRRFRALSKDKFMPFLWPDDELTDWLNDAQAQACVRGRLLLEDADPAVCQIAIEAGRHTYPLHAKVYELVSVRFMPTNTGHASDLKVVSREWLDTNYRDWRTAIDCTRRYVLQGETSVRIVPTPAKDGVLTIEAYRLPLTLMAAMTDAPEIHEASHEHLIDWALHKAFSVPDAESFDPQRSALAEESFTAYFGLLPDSDMRRVTREDVQHLNKVYL